MRSVSPGRGPLPELPSGVPLVAVTRGGRVESVHRGSVVVTTASGRVLAAVGDPLRPTLLRSSAKPFQLVPFLAAGGERRFRLTTREVAVAAASHGGEPFHVETVRGMLARGGFDGRALHCGAHPPMHEPSARALLARREEPGPLHNNCSGKHAAMLLACRQHGLPPLTYWRPDHPWQARIRAYLGLVAGVAPERIPIAVDGCSVPVFELPLHRLGVAYARLFGPRLEGESATEARARARVREAMTAAPEMVAGSGRFTTAVMREFGGSLVAKEGAEGVYAMAVMPGFPGGPPGAGIGIALKIEDGAERGRDAVCVEVLRQLGVASGELLARLRRRARRPVRNVRGDVVGEIRPVFRLGRFDMELPAGGTGRP